MASAYAGHRFISSVILIFCLSLLSVPVDARRLKSSLKVNEDWTFLTRFCFLSQNGRFNFVFKYPKSYGVQSLLLYYDAPGQWEGAYKSSKNCSERSSVLSRANNQIIDLTNRITGSRDAGCTVYQQSGEDWYNCTDEVSFRAARERWWYIVIARCGAAEGGKTGLYMDYEMHLMNGDDDDFLRHELSADEFYIFPVDCAFMVAFLILLLLSILCAVKLYNRQMFHTTYKMYMTALSLWVFGLFLKVIAWGKYSSSGWEEDPTEVTGRLFEAASTTVFLLMLILLAKGYSVTRGRLTQMSTVRITVFFCLYVIVNITLFIWEGNFFDEGLVLYFYESPPGYGLIGMRLVGWLWFLYAFFFTMKHHPQKAKFYVPFFIFYTIWFWAGPIVILIAIFNIAKWSREKTVSGVEQFVAFCGYLFFLILTRPSAANTNFPFHLRVSQVRFSNEEDEEPETRYGVSEDSQRHMADLFVVDRGVRSQSAAPPHNNTSYAMVSRGNSNNHHNNNNNNNSDGGDPDGRLGNGYINGGYGVGHEGGSHGNGYMKSPNGYNPNLEAVFTTQANGHLPPISTHATATEQHPQQIIPPSAPDPPPAYDNAEQESPPCYQTLPQLPPLPAPGGGGLHLPPISRGGGLNLPPISGSSLPPLSGVPPPLPSEKDQD